jgi:hypothetical protein
VKNWLPRSNEEAHKELSCTARGRRVHRADAGCMTGPSQPPSPTPGRGWTTGRTWMHSQANGSACGAHAVEFSKTAVPSRRGSSSGRTRAGNPMATLASGHTSIAPDGPARGIVCERAGGHSDRPVTRPGRPPIPTTPRARGRAKRPQDATCTRTIRWRGRSSKSRSTTCCQVPRARRPPTTGTASEAPMSAARMWAWELVS